MVTDGLENLLSGRFDLCEVVAPFAHLRAQFCVGPTRFFRRCCMLAGSAYQLFVQPDDCLEGFNGQPTSGVDVRQTQRLIQRTLLRAFESDLQRRASAWRLRGEEVCQLNSERFIER